MIIGLLLKSIKRFFNLFGLEVHRSSGKRSSFVGALRQIKDLGFTPATIIDIGAGIGLFTVQCYSVFPDSRYLLIEPLEENRDLLDQTTKRIPNAEYILAVADAQSGERTLNVHSDLVGSSLYLEKEANLDGTPRNVPAVTLDYICKERNASGPYLIKIDVQGAELDVLSGAKEVLDKTEYVILEVSLFQFVKGGPQLYDVVTFMKSCGFVVYDMFGHHYRLLDGAMAQIDIAFVKEMSIFRRDHTYANPKQREKLTKSILRYR
jgi:FkbM family methyltransferase